MMTDEYPHANLRVLVAIASFGKKNLPYLYQIIQAYQCMAFAIDLVVISEAPKNLPAGVENVVGLPSRNPWTLPFAHKPIFAQRADQYDLFIYSEDDIGVTQTNIDAFLRATQELEPYEIPGFLRYEVDQSGVRFLDEPWGHYHWIPESVRRRGVYTVAEFTNEHAGFYILTQRQLKRAIASGGFLRGPCRGRYGWPETAATDPYTNCGFRKVICISVLEKFLVRHMPNTYLHQLDVSFESFNEQIETLMNIRDGTHPASSLCEVESKRWPCYWQKPYYEKPTEVLLNLVPREARSILSIGCGWGNTESQLQQRGFEVTAIPLDSVIGAVAERRGIGMTYGTWVDCVAKLDGRKFDCVLMTNLLHLQPNPADFIKKCSQFIKSDGSLVLGGPNFNRLPWLIKRATGIGDFWKLRNFELSGFSLCGPGTLAKPFKNARLRITNVEWINHTIERSAASVHRIRLGCLTARDWVLRASTSA
jgi:2-polyprenyl-3-methyl-5-hydroxy-6-metoxy-1,4-benzoquinol methylase